MAGPPAAVRFAKGPDVGALNSLGLLLSKDGFEPLPGPGDSSRCYGIGFEGVGLRSADEPAEP